MSKEDTPRTAAARVKLPERGPKPRLARPARDPSDHETPVTPAPRGRPRRRGTFFPVAPRNVVQTGLDPSVIEELVLRWLVRSGGGAGRAVCEGVALPLAVVREVIDALSKLGQVRYIGTNVLGDFLCEPTERGRQRAAESQRATTAYVGPAPVPWDAFVEAVEAQAPDRVPVTPEGVAAAVAPLVVAQATRDQLGMALTDGRSVLLHGPPGCGKTSLVWRLARAWPAGVWIPRTVLVGGVLTRLYTPGVHEEAPPRDGRPGERLDERWVRVVRPTVALDLDALALGWDDAEGVGRAPVWLLAAMGVLVVDDLGRAGGDSRTLLHRLAPGLEGRPEVLRTPDGTRVPMPVCWITAVATGGDPVDVLGDAALRRMAHKVRLGLPDRAAFVTALEVASEDLDIPLDDGVADVILAAYEHLDDLSGRPPRFGDAPALLRAAAAWCRFRGRPTVADEASITAAIRSYLG